MSVLNVITGDLVIAAVAFVAGWIFGQKVKEWVFDKVAGWFRK